MTRQEILIVLERWLFDLCVAYARAKVAHFRNGGSPGSLALSGGRGTEFNARLQAIGKIGECAVALLLGMDPLTALNWDERLSDNGWDISIANGWLIDVKTTLPNRKLIWSRTVNHLYWEKTFTHLASVTVDSRRYSHCSVEGVISKEDFFARKLVADGSTPRGLEAGTWFMEKTDLNDFAEAMEQKI